MIQQFAQALTVTALALLFWQGGRPERICVALTVVALLVTADPSSRLAAGRGPS